jgi:hypothetical protein
MRIKDRIEIVKTNISWESDRESYWEIVNLFLSLFNFYFEIIFVSKKNKNNSIL